MTTKIETLKSVFNEAVKNEAAIRDELEARLNEAQNDEEREEIKRAFMRANTHARYNELLRDMSEKAFQQLLKLKIDAKAMTEQSRELKKRSIKILEALAHAQRVDDRALDAVMQRLAEKRDSSLTIAQIQREMQHETSTQAQYFKTCALFFNFATYNKNNKEVIFNYDTQVLKALMNIYAV